MQIEGGKCSLGKGCFLCFQTTLSFLLSRSFSCISNFLWDLGLDRTFNFHVPIDSDGKELACNVGDLGSIPDSGRSPGEGNGNPLQYSFLEKSMDRGVWWATVHGVTKSRTQLNDFHTLDFTDSILCLLTFLHLLKPFCQKVFLLPEIPVRRYTTHFWTYTWPFGPTVALYLSIGVFHDCIDSVRL